jgi:hypothetical protein
MTSSLCYKPDLGLLTARLGGLELKTRHGLVWSRLACHGTPFCGRAPVSSRFLLSDKRHAVDSAG